MFGGSRESILRQALLLFAVIAGALGVSVGWTLLLISWANWLFGIRIQVSKEVLAVFAGAGFAASALFALAGSYFLSWRLERELEDIRIGMRMLSRGRLSFRWSESDRRGFGDVRAELNQMAEKWEKQVKLLQALAEEKERLADKAREAGIADERQRLARELHDAVSQQLFALSMNAAAAVRLIDKDPRRAREKILSLESMAQKALSEMRALLLHLRPVQLTEQSLGETLRDMLDELQQKGVLKCTCSIEEELNLNRSIEANLLRIAQEAVANTLRHAQAQNLRLSLSSGQGVAYLSIEDDGVGFDPGNRSAKKVSYGLQTMKERAEECGGSLDVVSVKGKGTRVDVRIPLPQGSWKDGGEK